MTKNSNDIVGGGYTTSGFVFGKLACEALAWLDSILRRRNNRCDRTLQSSSHEIFVDAELTLKPYLRLHQT